MRMQIKPRVIALIVHFNTPSLTAECVESLSVFPNVEIFIWDNCSEFKNWVGLLHACERMNNVRLHRSEFNLGYGGGINRGIELAAPTADDYLWIMNSDMRVEGDALTPLLAALEDGGVEMVAPFTFSGDPERPRVYFAGGILDLDGVRAIHWSVGQDFHPSGYDPIPCSYLNGACLLLRFETWLRLGGMRDDLFLYWEDADLSFRAGKLGMRLAAVPTAVMWHRVGASTSDEGLSRVAYYYSARNRILVGITWGVALRSFLMGRGAPETFRILIRPLLHERLDRRGRWLAAFKGTLAGLCSARRCEMLGSLEDGVRTS
jgi:N-acetylglucosaminyl-diphospho-decaprenol L-rhamnosyltransferase